MERFPTFKRIGRWVLRVVPRVAVALLALLVIAAIPWTYLNITYGRDLQRELSALKAEGMPTSPRDLAPKPVPNEQNAAVLYQKVFQIPPSRWGDASTGEHFAGEGEKPFAGLSREEMSVLEDYLKSGGTKGGAACRRLLARPEAREALRVLREASRRPRCVFPVHWEAGMAALFPHYAAFLQAARLVNVHAALLAADGRIAEALDWYEVSLRMADHIASEPGLVSQQASFMVRQQALDSLSSALSPARVPASAAKGLQEYLGGLNLNSPFIKAMQGERAMACWAFDLLQRDPKAVGEDVGIFSCVPIVGRPWQKLDYLAYLRYSRREMEYAAQPYRVGVAGTHRVEQEVEKLSWRAPWTGVLLAVHSAVAAKRDEAEARIGLCRVFLALKAYQYEHASYPATLQQLQGSLSWELPDDPFSGQAFVYRKVGKGLKLYSIGRDLTDNGGAPPPKNRLEPGDIVWECTR